MCHLQTKHIKKIVLIKLNDLIKYGLDQVECYAEHETLGENKKAFSHVIEILGGPVSKYKYLKIFD